MQAIDIKKLNFNYGKIKVFDNFNLTISEGCFVTILGKNGSGKTTLVNILAKRLNFKGEILFFGDSLNKKIAFIFDDMDEYEISDKVIDVLAGVTKGKNKKEKIIDVALEFGFLDFLNDDFNSLPLEKKKLIILGKALIQKPKVLIIDNLFEDMDKDLKGIILKKLKKYMKGMTIVNFSNDVEEALFSDMVVIIGDGKILLKGSKRKVFENETFFENYDLELPFVVNLSNKLKFYDLVDKVYFDEAKLVDDLWG